LYFRKGMVTLFFGMLAGRFGRFREAEGEASSSGMCEDIVLLRG
jgi:hypothetical protein